MSRRMFISLLAAGLALGISSGAEPGKAQIQIEMAILVVTPASPARVESEPLRRSNDVKELIEAMQKSGTVELLFHEKRRAAVASKLHFGEDQKCRFSRFSLLEKREALPVVQRLLLDVEVVAKPLSPKQSSIFIQGHLLWSPDVVRQVPWRSRAAGTQLAVEINKAADVTGNKLLHEVLRAEQMENSIFEYPATQNISLDASRVISPPDSILLASSGSFGPRPPHTVFLWVHVSE